MYVGGGCDERPNLSKELKHSAIHEYEHHFEFSLALGCANGSPKVRF